MLKLSYDRAEDDARTHTLRRNFMRSLKVILLHTLAHTHMPFSLLSVFRWWAHSLDAETQMPESYSTCVRNVSTSGLDWRAYMFTRAVTMPEEMITKCTNALQDMHGSNGNPNTPSNECDMLSHSPSQAFPPQGWSPDAPQARLLKRSIEERVAEYSTTLQEDVAWLAGARNSSSEAFSGDASVYEERMVVQYRVKQKELLNSLFQQVTEAMQTHTDAQHTINQAVSAVSSEMHRQCSPRLSREPTRVQMCV